MAYETRLERRLKLEAEQRQKRLRRVRLLLIAIVSLMILFAIITYFGHEAMSGGGAETANSQGNSSASKDDGQDNDSQDNNSSSSVDKGELIESELPNKIAEINSRLGIIDRQGLAGLPSTTTTAVALIDLSDQGVSNVDYNGDLQFTSASTYKLLVAYAMIHDVETGRRNWSSPINGTTWEGCLNQMIINSDNTCPETYLAVNGHDNLTKIAHSLGLSDSTNFAVDDMRMTANDLALFLQKLYQGELVSEENRDKLLSLMQQQRYREGIPAGIGDQGVVADKVGFLYDLLNDAAIVQSGSGDYVLVILTNGESWSYIAQLAQYIDEIMRQ